jgi:leucyl aminopeptidase
MILKPKISATLDGFVECDALVLFLAEDVGWENDALFSSLNEKSNGLLLAEAREAKFNGKRYQLVVISARSVLPYKRIFLLGLGKRREAAGFEFRKAGALCARGFVKFELKSVCIGVGDSVWGQHRREGLDHLQKLYQGILLAGYRFDRYKSLPAEDSNPDLELCFAGGGLSSSDADVFTESKQLVGAIRTARDWVNEPAAQLTPEVFSERATQWWQGSKVESLVLNRAGLEKERMEMVIGVGKGSEAAPCLVHAWFKPDSPKRKIALVGKGVTFDSGGYSLKPSDSMKDMKGDMAGAALVLSAIRLVAEANLPLEVHVIAPCAENMVSGGAYRLGDVLRSRAGKTVEITNTDAEGRLLLADALSYACDIKPDLVIDFATLTGACVVALGPFIAGVMGTDQEAISAWLAAGKQAGEDMWQLPLPEALKDQLKSEVADLKNAGDRWGGALTAGLFLKEFVGETPWFHVDIAGPAYADKESGEYSKGGTGFGIPTLFEFLKVYAGT